MGVADDEMHLVALDRRDDGVAVRERQRHRLFQDDVLAVLGRHDGVRRVELVRRRDVDDLDRRVGGELLHVGVGRGIEVAGEGLARAGMRIGGGAQRIAGVGRRGVDHDRPGHAETADSEPDRP